MQQRWAGVDLARAAPAPYSVMGEPQGRLPLKPASSAPVQLPAAAIASAPANSGKRVLGSGIAQVQGKVLVHPQRIDAPYRPGNNGFHGLGQVGAYLELAGEAVGLGIEHEELRGGERGGEQLRDGRGRRHGRRVIPPGPDGVHGSVRATAAAPASDRILDGPSVW